LVLGHQIGKAIAIEVAIADDRPAGQPVIMRYAAL
jgi:hypothetical protein